MFCRGPFSNECGVVQSLMSSTCQNKEDDVASICGRFLGPFGENMTVHTLYCATHLVLCYTPCAVVHTLYCGTHLAVWYTPCTVVHTFCTVVHT